MLWATNEVVLCCWCITGYDLDEKIIFKLEFYRVLKTSLVGNLFLNDLIATMHYPLMKCIPAA